MRAEVLRRIAYRITLPEISVIMMVATVVLEARYLYAVLPFLVVGAALTITALLERR